jgi:hypothetical protein
VLTSDEFKDSLPKPAERPPFVLQTAKDGLGRFREKGEPIGITEGRMFRPPIDVNLTAGPATWLRVAPLSDLGRVYSIAELRRAMDNGMLMPLYHGPGGYGWASAHDGIGVYWATSEATTSNVVFVFKTGEVWTINSNYVNETAERNMLPLWEKDFNSALARYATYLQKLGIERPFQWIAGLEGIKGRGIYMPHWRGNQVPAGRAMLDVVEVNGTYMPDEESSAALESFYARAYEVCGLERPEKAA